MNRSSARSRENKCRKRATLFRAGSIVLATIVSPLSRAYEIPLAPSAVHEAWVLGQRNDQATAELLSPYSKDITEAATGSGPYISEMEVLTPFVQVVDESRQRLSGYTDEQASKAYRQRGDTIIVRVRLMLPSAYPQAERSPKAPPASHGQTAALKPENFWQSFQFAVKQHGKVIHTRSIHNKPVYSAATNAAPSTLDGQTVWLEYDAKTIASDELTVEVTTPDGKTSSSLFDLKKLR